MARFDLEAIFFLNYFFLLFRLFTIFVVIIIINVDYYHLLHSQKYIPLS